jgi:Raf kinase inhibitor-like YbhB/YbcL family protein
MKEKPMLYRRFLVALALLLAACSAQPTAPAPSPAASMEDRDFDNYTHWVLFNIPPETRELAAAIADGESVAGIGLHAQSSFAQPGYRGPCPDPGDTHSYTFTLYALDQMLPLEPGPTSPVSKGMVRDAMRGHILGEGMLGGMYTRP